MRLNILVLFLLFTAVLITAESAGATTVPLEWRLASDYRNVAELSQWESVTSNPSYYDIPWGDVTDENGSMLTEHARLYFKDSEGQIVGIIPVDFWTSTYDFTGTDAAIYGDIDTTPMVKEGIPLHETPGVIAWLMDSNNYYLGEISSGRLKTEGFVAEGMGIGVNNILVDRNSPIPEPATICTLAVGGIVLLFRREQTDGQN
ncbi:MAG: hypothetical protein MUP16_11375 [Sedimentisphaerales bacterium]|nr:hypothetical protein [Sedimentisphaerales bacterium]